MKINPLDFIGYPMADVPRVLINALPIELIEDQLKERNFAYFADAAVKSVNTILDNPVLMLMFELGQGTKTIPPMVVLEDIPGILEILKSRMVDGKLPPDPIPEVDQICFQHVKQYGLFETIGALNTVMGKF